MLDVVYRDPTLGQQCIDVAIVDSEGTAAADPKIRMAISRKERVKQRRYPGEGLVPFVLDTRGRWGHYAQVWLLAASRHLEPAERSGALAKARKLVGRALQQGVAEQILAGAAERRAPQGAAARGVRQRQQ